MRRCDRATTANRRRAAAWLTLVVAGGAAAGCSQVIETPLPEIGQLTRHLLSAEEQKKAVEDLQQSKSARQAEAIREIERDRAGADQASGAPTPAGPLTSRAQ
jgi:hypothetical protein